MTEQIIAISGVAGGVLTAFFAFKGKKADTYTEVLKELQNEVMALRKENKELRDEIRQLRDSIVDI